MIFQRILYSFVFILITLQSSHLIAQSAVYIPCMQDTTKVLSLTITQPVCGNNTGSIHVVTNNNQTFYGYLLTDSLNNFQVINGTFNDEFTISNIPVGNYFLTVGCDSTKLYTYPDTIRILPSTPLYTNYTLSHVTTPNGTNGSVTICITSGTPPFLTEINNPNAQTTHYGSTPTCLDSISITQLTAGTYILTTSDAEGCTQNDTFTITQPSCLFSATTLATTPATCYNTSNGSATILAANGQAPFTFQFNTQTYTQTNDTFYIQNIAAGTYTLSVTDANQCNTQHIFSITQPDSLYATYTLIQPTAQNVGGAICITPTGGTPPYQIVASCGTVQTPSSICSSPFSIENLSEGTCIITIRDNNLCEQIDTIQLTRDWCSDLQFKIVTKQDAPCTDSLGSITVRAQGGTLPYTYTLGTQTNIDAQGYGATFHVPAGSYTVTANTPENCTASITFTISEPTPIQIQNSTIQPNAQNIGGAICITIAGGTPPYEVLASCGTVQTQSSVCNAPFSVENLSEGTCIITVHDANLCETSDTVQLVKLSCDDLIFEITNKEDATCSGAMGHITVQATSGTLPYTYTLGTQTDIDEQGSGATFDIPAGNYTIFVRTADGCTESLLFSISEPSALVLTLDNTSQSCSNTPTGAITSNLQGGTPPYTYTWSNGANTQNIHNIAAGNYTLTVHDANGCITSGTVLVPSYADFDVDAGIDVTITAGQTTELSGTTTAIPPYTVLWTPSTGLSNASIVNPVVSATETTTYTLQITSADGCANTDAVVVTVVPFVKDAFAIPSAFTPNGDNRNDIFRPIATGTVQVNRFLVLNKWGEKIHEGIEGWDGTYKNAPQPVGSYTYLVEYKDVDGEQKSKAGQVMLIR